jgi:hypothetical protein
VFLLDTPAADAFSPVTQANEISDILWVDLEELYNPLRFQPLVWSLKDLVPSSPMWFQRVVQASLGDLIFGAIYLPRPTHAAPDTDVTTTRTIHDFVLWGLTLRMIADLGIAAQCPLPMTDKISPQFESKTVGRLVLFLYRQPAKAIAIAAACAALGLISRL